MTLFLGAWAVTLLVFVWLFRFEVNVGTSPAIFIVHDRLAGSFRYCHFEKTGDWACLGDHGQNGSPRLSADDLKAMGYDKSAKPAAQPLDLYERARAELDKQISRNPPASSPKQRKGE